MPTTLKDAETVTRAYWEDRVDTFTAEVAIVIDTHPQVTSSVLVMRPFLAHRSSPPVPASSHVNVEGSRLDLRWPVASKVLLVHALVWAVLGVAGLVAALLLVRW